MMSKVMMSKSTSQITQVSQLVKTINAGIVQSQADKSPEPDLQLAREADIAIVDGKAILEGNEEEHGILISALESGLPIIMKNATSEAMTSFIGVGIDAETVLLRKAGKGTQVETIEQGDLEARLAQAQTSSTPDKKEVSSMATGGGESQSMQDTEELMAFASLRSESVTKSSTDAVSGASPMQANPFGMERPDLPDESYQAFYVQQVIRTVKWDTPGENDNGTVGPVLKNEGSIINIGYLIELFATDYPKQKYVQITTAGTGFSLGIAKSLSLTDRGWYLEYARNEFGPDKSDDGFLERMAPEAENTSTNITTSTGFGVGVDESVGFEGKSLTGSLGVSANWDWSRSASIDLPDFTVRSITDYNCARWEYRLSKVGDDVYYNGWNSLVNEKALEADTLHALPVMAYTSIPIHHQAVWRFAPNENRTIPMIFIAAARVRRVFKSSDEWAHPGRIFHSFKYFDVDLSAVTHEHPAIYPKPEFLSAVKRKDGTDDLVFYRPGTDSIFYLKSLGDGDFEIIRTDVDFDNLKATTTRPAPVRNYLTTHRVRAGESLSSIAYKYYHSWVPEMWKRIHEANKDMIGKNPIRPNMVLTIPFKDGPIHDIGPRG